VSYRLVACRGDEAMLDQLADDFMDFIFDKGQNAVTAYVEPRTAQNVRA